MGIAAAAILAIHILGSGGILPAQPEKPFVIGVMFIKVIDPGGYAVKVL